jgi:hypothetical protein
MITIIANPPLGVALTFAIDHKKRAGSRIRDCRKVWDSIVRIPFLETRSFKRIAQIRERRKQ